MKKIVFQGWVIIALFFALLFLLRQIDWVSVLKIEETTKKTEERLGELFWGFFKKTDQENKNQFVANAIDSIVTQVCNHNKIERNKIKLHILMKDEVNAFALPDGHLIVYSGLIVFADNQSELSGVICHEIAHIELNHVMKKLLKEIGLSVLISMATGNSSTEIITETAKMLSSTAFDRNLEKEADIKSVDYLIKSNINPEPFANFLYRLAGTEDGAMQYLSWINTHPDSRERAIYILEHTRNKTIKDEPVLTEETWQRVKKELENGKEN